MCFSDVLIYIPHQTPFSEITFASIHIIAVEKENKRNEQNERTYERNEHYERKEIDIFQLPLAGENGPIVETTLRQYSLIV